MGDGALWNLTRDFEVFLPKLLAALERKGLSEAAIVFAGSQ